MKSVKTLLTALSLFLSVCVAKASDEIIAFETLPFSSQEFIKSNFEKMQIASTQKETTLLGLITDSYEVNFVDGSEVEFNSDGNWTKISIKNGEVPSNLIPEKIKQYVKTNFKNHKIVEFEQSEKGYKIELSNDMDLKFNKNFIFIGADR